MSRGPYQMIIPCDIGDTIYKISVKKQEISHWYVYEIKKDEEKDWIVLAKSNKNKYKFNSIEIPFADFGEKFFVTKPEADNALEYASTPELSKIVHKCGHSSEVQLTGTKKYRERTKYWLKQKVCPVCRNEESEKKGYPLVEIPYGEYKRNFKNCDTKVGSYNKETGTIKVYVPSNI